MPACAFPQSAPSELLTPTQVPEPCDCANLRKSLLLKIHSATKGINCVNVCESEKEKGELILSLQKTITEQ